MYVGRFAPSPTGPLHFGSLVAAVGSYLQARHAAGAWLVRIEDLDTPRVIPGAAERILRTLETLGLQWAGSVEYQSKRLPLYRDALDRLRAAGRVYRCVCTRSQLAALDESRYPGTCRGGLAVEPETYAERFIVEPGIVEFDDLVQGHYAEDVAQTGGDFIVRRRDGIYAYHLAVVVDDHAQGVTEVVRGADLLDSTPRHILLQRALGIATPSYCHLPLAIDADGRKLSKSSQSLAIDAVDGSKALWEALRFLQLDPPTALQGAPPAELLDWALPHWRLQPLKRVKSDRAPPP